jgi:hypothetical protein
LREIANDPEGYIRQQGWASVELADEKEIAALRRLLEMLQIKIVEVIEATNELKESPDYELYNLSQRDASILDTVSEKQKQQIEAECNELSEESKDLEKQIEELIGEQASGAEGWLARANRRLSESDNLNHFRSCVFRPILHLQS